MPVYRVIQLPGHVVVSKDDNLTFSCDRNFRLFHSFLFGKSYRFGFDGRIIQIWTEGLENYSRIYVLRKNEKHLLFQKFNTLLEEIKLAPHDHFLSPGNDFLSPNESKKVIKEIQNTLSRKNRDLEYEKFKNLYGSVPILPPDCYSSLLIQLTQGCHYNQCRFCTFYKNRPFKILSLPELKTHLEKILEFQGKSLLRWKSIFLGDANSLIIPQSKLVAMIKLIQETFQNHQAEFLTQQIFSFADTSQEIRTLRDYQDLQQLGLKRIYVGLETGCSSLRLQMKKPGSMEWMLKKIQTIKEAQIGVGVIALAGIGGSKFAKSHMEETIQFLLRCSLNSQDIIYISPFRIQKDSSYLKWQNQEQIEPFSEEQVWDQTQFFLSELGKNFSRPGPKISLYDIDRFVY